MGWNDHVDFIETECLQCGVVAVWEHWNEIAKARYGGELGRKLGHDVANSGKCPHCGSIEGEVVEED